MLEGSGHVLHSAVAAVDPVDLGGEEVAVEEGDAEAGEQREFEALDPAEFPHTVRMISEAHYIGHDGEFEFGLDAIIRGLLAGPRDLPEARP